MTESSLETPLYSGGETKWDELTRTCPTNKLASSSRTVKLIGAVRSNSGSLSLTSVTTMFTVVVDVCRTEKKQKTFRINFLHQENKALILEANNYNDLEAKKTERVALSRREMEENLGETGNVHREMFYFYLRPELLEDDTAVNRTQTQIGYR